MSSSDNVLDALVRQLRARAPQAKPRVAVVLGSGWSALTEQVQDPLRIPYAERAGFP